MLRPTECWTPKHRQTGMWVQKMFILTKTPQEMEQKVSGKANFRITEYSGETTHTTHMISMAEA